MNSDFFIVTTSLQRERWIETVSRVSLQPFKCHRPFTLAFGASPA